MTLFDCLFIKAAKMYARGENKFDGISAISVLALMQFLNIYSFVLSVGLIFHYKPPIKPWMIIVMLALLVVGNGVRYNKIDYFTLRKRWEQTPENKQQRLNTLIPVYIVVSVILMLVTAQCISQLRP